MRWLALLLLALAAGCAPASGPAPAPYTLTYASPYPPRHPFSRADSAWMDHVTKASGGRILFKPYWSGGLISSEMSMLELRHGLADIALITPIYTRGGAHMLRTQSGFYSGVASLEDQVQIYDCLAGEFSAFGDELRGLHVLAVQGGNFPGVLTRSTPVRTLADLRGLRLRAQSDAIDVLRELGADPVSMPMGEVYSALAKGVIDGVVAPADTIRSLHFAEVARHFTALKFSRGAYPARAISDAAWQRLPPDLRQLLAAAKPVWEQALAEQIAQAERDGFAFAAQHGVEVIRVPAAEQQRFDALYNRAALKQARRLATFGLAGEPVFRRAQGLIAGGEIRCAARSPGARN